MVSVLLQFLAQRKGYVVEKKYKTMLRWAKYCMRTKCGLRVSIHRLSVRMYVCMCSWLLAWLFPLPT